MADRGRIAGQLPGKKPKVVGRGARPPSGRTADLPATCEDAPDWFRARYGLRLDVALTTEGADPEWWIWQAVKAAARADMHSPAELSRFRADYYEKQGIPIPRRPPRRETVALVQFVRTLRQGEGGFFPHLPLRAIGLLAWAMGCRFAADLDARATARWSDDGRRQAPPIVATDTGLRRWGKLLNENPWFPIPNR